MDFQLTDEQRMMKETVYKWAVKELGPIQEKIDEEDWFPPDFFKKCAEIGILGITIAEEYGGLDGDILMQTLAVEEMSRICPALGMTYGTHSNLCANNIHRNAGPALKKRYLPPMVAGEKIGALALTEPNAGSDAMGIRTRAVKRAIGIFSMGAKSSSPTAHRGHPSRLRQNHAGTGRQGNQCFHCGKRLSWIFRLPQPEEMRDARISHRRAHFRGLRGSRGKPCGAAQYGGPCDDQRSGH